MELSRFRGRPITRLTIARPTCWLQQVVCTSITFFLPPFPEQPDSHPFLTTIKGRLHWSVSAASEFYGLAFSLSHNKTMLNPLKLRPFPLTCHWPSWIFLSDFTSATLQLYNWMPLNVFVFFFLLWAEHFHVSSLLGSLELTAWYFVI